MNNEYACPRVGGIVYRNVLATVLLSAKHALAEIGRSAQSGLRRSRKNVMM